MIYRVLRSGISILTLLAIVTMTQTADSNTDGSKVKHESVSVGLTPTLEQPLWIYYYESQGAGETEKMCTATITVPLSAYPSARLAGRPADFASAIREKLDAWNVSKCSIVVWLNNDTSDNLPEEETCLSEDFRYDGDSVWSVSSESFCYPEVSCWVGQTSSSPAEI